MGSGELLGSSMAMDSARILFFETAIQFALNGFIVHLIDFEGFGYSGGLRVSGIAVEKMHR